MFFNKKGDLFFFCLKHVTHKRRATCGVCGWSSLTLRVEEVSMVLKRTLLENVGFLDLGIGVIGHETTRGKNENDEKGCQSWAWTGGLMEDHNG